MQKLLTKSFRKILHDIGTEEIRKEEDGNSRPRLRSLKVLRNIHYVARLYFVEHKWKESNYCSNILTGWKIQEHNG